MKKVIIDILYECIREINAIKVDKLPITTRLYLNSIRRSLIILQNIISAYNFPS